MPSRLQFRLGRRIDVEDGGFSCKTFAAEWNDASQRKGGK